MSGVVVSVSVSPCCDRLKFLSNILQQAKNLNLNDEYVLAVENIILTMVPLIKAEQQEQVITAYDNAIDNILTLRDNAFEEWANEVKNLHIPVEKTSPP